MSVEINFLDNQVYAANALNNIAIDLGNTTFAKFTDHKNYAVTELNEITKHLVTKGVLNAGNQCKVFKSGNSFCVPTGVIVFESGAKIRITKTEYLDMLPQSVNYVYATYNAVSNSAFLTVSATTPENGDFVMLASMSVDGVLTDLRNMCQAKVDLKGTNPTRLAYVDLEWIAQSIPHDQITYYTHTTYLKDVSAKMLLFDLINFNPTDLKGNAIEFNAIVTYDTQTGLFHNASKAINDGGSSQFFESTTGYIRYGIAFTPTGVKTIKLTIERIDADLKLIFNIKCQGSISAAKIQLPVLLVGNIL